MLEPVNKNQPSTSDTQPLFYKLFRVPIILTRFMNYRLLAICLSACLLGSGCTGALIDPHTVSPAAKDRRPAWLIPREGIAIVTEANVEVGPIVSITDGPTARFFTAQLPGIFRDERGRYTTTNPEETIQVQLGVGGSALQDHELFIAQPGLERFESAIIQGWQTNAAYQVSLNRWIIRATKTDPFQPEGMYHVIECIGATNSNNLFWDGCRTLIETARIDQSRAPAL